MEWTQQQLKALRQGASAGNQGTAPRAVLEAAGSLLGSPEDDLLGIVCGASDDNGHITWRLAILTARMVIYVEAKRQANVWALNFGEERPAESLTAWARPVRAVTGVEVKSTKSIRDHFSDGSEWRWTTNYEINFADVSLRLPLADWAADDVSDRADQFVRELLQRI